jgi:DNA-binding XRE family transcriptional regulator
MSMVETKRVEGQEGISHAALTMAVAIVAERIQRLPADDRNDLYQLFKDLATAETCEDRESIEVSILEILDQRPVGVLEMPLTESKPSAGLQKWLDHVSKRIRDLRKAANLTQEQLATKAALPQSHISRLESAKHSPSRATLDRIAKALKVSLSKIDPSA